MTKLYEIEKRVNEIQDRMQDIGGEAPALAKVFDDAVASGNGAKAMFCQMVMASRIMELKELQIEVNEMKKALRII